MFIPGASVRDGKTNFGRGRGVLYQREGQWIKRPDGPVWGCPAFGGMERIDPLNPINPLTGSKVNP